MITSPVYYPFHMAVEQNNRIVVEDPLILSDLKYEFDFDDFEKKTSMDNVILYIMSSPHNPMGRIWTKEELERICEICLRNKVFMIADEIHFDLIMPGYSHVSVGTFKQKCLDNYVICTTPGKTSNLFISNPEYRKFLHHAKGYHSLNALRYKACGIDYSNCDEWFSQLLELLDGNRRLTEDFIVEKLPEIKVFLLEGTYLQWLDLRSLGLDYQELESFMKEKAYRFFVGGYVLGGLGKGFERLHLVCPRDTLKNALERLYVAMTDLKTCRK